MTSDERDSVLALHGGPKLRTEPFPPRGIIGLEEKAAVVALFDRVIAEGSSITYGGEEEEAYCREFCDLMGGGYADGVSSGTTALYVALKALELEPFSEIIVGAVTDPGGMMPIPLLNLVPIVADSIPGGYNTGPQQIEPLISPLTSAIVVSHIAGEPADMEAVMELAGKRDIPVIEDCAQAHGGRLCGKMLGTFGSVAVFSTMFGKHHTTGGQGGIVYTENEDLYDRVRQAADRGKPVGLPQGSTNCMAALNLNLNEIAAVIGRIQLRKLPGIVRRRQEVVRKIREGTGHLKTISVPTPIAGAEPSYWFLRMEFHSQPAKCDKETFCQALLAEGLPVSPAYRGALPHMMDWFNNRRVFGKSGYPWTSPDYKGDPDREFPTPNAVNVMETQFNLSIHENWGEEEIKDTVAILEKVETAFKK
jgi:perosamine synthetase